MSTLRNRARDLVRNNPYAARAIRALTTNIVGTGIRPVFRTGNEAIDRQAQALWDEWVEQCTISSPMTLYGLQELAVRAWLTDGEVLVRRRFRRVEDGLPVPVQLQVLEADMLDTSRDGELKNGRRIIGGIEFDALGQRKAYWLYKEHPGGRFAWKVESVAVPAAAVAHLYQEVRPGQVRGVSWLAPVITSLWDFAGYQDAERLRKRAEACVVAFVTGGNPDEVESGQLADGIGTSVATDADGNPIEELAPGLVAYLPPYKDVKFNSPSATSGYAEFARVSLHEIAAGLDIPYEILTQDLSQVSFVSMRMGLVQFRLLVRTLRRHYVIPYLCRPILSWWLDAAIAAGKLPDLAGGYKVRWSEPHVEEVDRLRDAQADLMELRNGTASWREIVAARGKDPDALLQEIAQERKLFEQLGVVFDSNPNQTTKAGDAPAVRGLQVDSPDDLGIVLPGGDDGQEDD